MKDNYEIFLSLMLNSVNIYLPLKRKIKKDLFCKKHTVSTFKSVHFLHMKQLLKIH